jgi:hypothetical protein
MWLQEVEMGIESKESLHHWNYFLALETDTNQLAQYIEFNRANFNTYSIRLAQLLLAASSEVDVVIKQICTLVEGRADASNIDDYQRIIRHHLPQFIAEEVLVERFGLTLRPWSDWATNSNPGWWRSYNNVKHERNLYFEEANLKNALNSVGGLLVAVFYYYKLRFANHPDPPKKPRDVTILLKPESQLFTLKHSYYYSHLVV